MLMLRIKPSRSHTHMSRKRAQCVGHQKLDGNTVSAWIIPVLQIKSVFGWEPQLATPCTPTSRYSQLRELWPAVASEMPAALCGVASRGSRPNKPWVPDQTSLKLYMQLALCLHWYQKQRSCSIYAFQNVHRPKDYCFLLCFCIPFPSSFLRFLLLFIFEASPVKYIIQLYRSACIDAASRNKIIFLKNYLLYAACRGAWPACNAT